MNRLQNKTALITGATSGIGKACAKYLAQNSVNLVLIGRRKEKLKNLKAKFEKKYKIKVQILCFDISIYKDVQQALKKLLKTTKIDILINNAGLALDASKIDECNINDWEQIIDTNIKGLLYISRIIIPHFRKNNNGHIINIGSIAGLMTYPNGNVYCATKSAVHTLSQAMNIDLVGTNIRVSNIAPGAVETEFSKVRFKGDDVKADAVYDGFTPLRANDIADIIIYVLNAPKHVNIQNTLIMPTAQRNPYVLYRE